MTVRGVKSWQENHFYIAFFLSNNIRIYIGGKLNGGDQCGTQDHTYWK